ncbi:MAG TPA: ribosome recycling factor [Bauldia sp.]|nr:ribosome recycling factor [Bauldia sp.]
MDTGELKRRMQGAVAALRTELSGLRTGRASSSLLEPIHVDAYGSSMPLNQVASVSVPEPRMLSVQVWDRALVSAVDRAIREANLGLNPIMDGTLLRIPIPDLTADRRQELVKIAHKYAEQARVAVRHVRRDGHDLLKKEAKSGVSEDQQRKLTDQIQKMTDDTISEIDAILSAKEGEITQV